MLKDYTHISVVLDASGSMLHIKGATMEGYNEFVANNSALPGKLTTTLTQFNKEVHVGPWRDGVLCQLNDANYHPGGCTALYDAIGKTINKAGMALNAMAEDQRPDKVIFLIVTDGEENASREFNNNQVASMIKLQQDQYKWEFIFMGANQDAWAVSGDLNIPHSNALSYGYTPRDTKTAWSGMTMNTMSYRSGHTSSASFTDAQVAEQPKDQL